MIKFIIHSPFFSKLSTICKYLIIAILIISSIIKFTDLGAFQTSLYKLTMVYDIFVPFISIFIPLLELFLALLLILKIKTYLASQYIIYLFIFFTSVVAIKYVEGTDADCGCFGTLIDNKIGMSTLMRNFLLLLISLVVYLKEEYIKNLSDESNLAFALNRNFKIFFMVLFLCVLSIQNVTFAIQNRELKNRIYLLIAEETLTPGETIDIVTVENLNGETLNLKFKNDKGYLVFIMKYGCQPCVQNQKDWSHLNNILSNKRYILGISVSHPELTTVLKSEYNVNYNLFSITDEEIKIKFKIFSTPKTILISKDGTVEKVYNGVLKEKDFNYLISL